MTFASGAGKALVLVALAGCSPADASGVQLSAQRHGDDVTLTWHGARGDVVVEFATEPDGRYTVLDFAPRTRTTFEHPDLMPATTFHCRVRPSKARRPGPPPRCRRRRSMARTGWCRARCRTTAPRPVAAARPANLRVESVGPDAVRLAWTDNATDEDGHLVERDAGDGYRVVFVMDPDVNHVGLIGDTTGAYRVRAYHYGPGSNVVHEEIPG